MEVALGGWKDSMACAGSPEGSASLAGTLLGAQPDTVSQRVSSYQGVNK